MTSRQHVLVVGAGIIGASIALYLLRAGSRVTVIEGNEPGGIATRNSFGWINATWGNPREYYRLRVHAMEEWHRLERAVPNVRVRWGGSLNWELLSEQLQRFATVYASWGYGTRLVGRAEASRLEPALAEPPDLAVHAPSEGAVEPFDAARAILAAVIQRGGTVIPANPVRALDVRNGRVSGASTNADHFTADETVIAAGAGAAPLLATAGLALPVRVLPSLIIASRPHAKLLNGLIITPRAEIRQTIAGRVVACSSFDEPNRDATDAAAALHAEVQATFRSGTTLALEQQAVGYGPIPEDGLPLVGRIGATAGLYVAVTHSGITLAPAIGQLVADEIVRSRQDPLLNPYRIERFRHAIS